MPTRYMDVGPIPPELLPPAREIVTTHTTYDARKAALKAWLADHSDVDPKKFCAALSIEVRRLFDE